MNEEAKKYLQIKLPTDFTNDIPLIGRLWLYKGGVTVSLWSKYGVGYSPKQGRVVLPVFAEDNSLNWLQCRAVMEGQKPKYLQPSHKREAVMFSSRGPQKHKKFAIIVEDILSAIRVGELAQSFALLGTKVTPAQAAELSTYDTIFTWLDGDEAGCRGSYAIRKTLSLITQVKNIHTEVDPKALSDEQINDVLKESIGDDYDSTT